MKTVLIANPRSAGGATAGRLDGVWSSAKRILGDDVEMLRTERPCHATDLAREVVADRLLVVGGDGTMNEVVDGLAQRPKEERPVLGLIPAGTGGDLARTLRMPADVDAALRVVRSATHRSVDWMCAEMPQGRRIAINVLGFGLSGAVVERVNRSSKRFGSASFAWATARATLAWKAPVVRVEWEGPDGRGRWEGELASVFLANGSYCGGGMWVGPDADLGDGAVDMTILPRLPHSRALWHARHLYDGRLGQVPGVVRARVERLNARVESGGEVLVDTDGEQPGTLPIEVVLEAGAVRMLGRWADSVGSTL